MPYNGPNIVNPVPTRSMGEFFRAKAAFEAHRVNGNYPVPGASGYLEDIADFPYAVQQQIYENTRVPWASPGADWRITSTSIEHVTTGTATQFSSVAYPYAEMTFTAASPQTGSWTAGFARAGSFISSASITFSGSTWGGGAHSWAVGDVFLIRVYKTTATVFQNGVQVSTGSTTDNLTYVAGFRSDTQGHKLDLVTFLPIPVTWWDTVGNSGWELSRTTATRTKDTLGTAVFQGSQAGTCGLTWTLASVPQADGAFTVGLTSVGGPYGTALGTEVQFQGSQAYYKTGKIACAVGDTFRLVWNAGVVTLVYNAGFLDSWTAYDTDNVTPLPAAPLVAYMTSDRAGDAIMGVDFREVIPPYWQTSGAIDAWESLNDPTRLVHRSEKASTVVATPTQSNGTEMTSASIEFKLDNAPYLKDTLVVGFTQQKVEKELPSYSGLYVTLTSLNLTYAPSYDTPYSGVALPLVGEPYVYRSADTLRVRIQGKSFNTPYLTVERKDGANYILLGAFAIREARALGNSDLTALNLSNAPYHAFVRMGTDPAASQGLTILSYDSVPSSNIVDWVPLSAGITYSNGTVRATVSGAVLQSVTPWLDADFQFTWGSGAAEFYLADRKLADISGGVLTAYDTTTTDPLDPLAVTRTLAAGDTYVIRLLGNWTAYNGSKTSSITFDKVVGGNSVRWFSTAYLPATEQSQLYPTVPTIIAKSTNLVLSNVTYVADGTTNPIWTPYNSELPAWRIADNWVSPATSQEVTPDTFPSTLLTSVGVYSNVSMSFTAEVVPAGGYLQVGVGADPPTYSDFPSGPTNTYDHWFINNTNWYLKNPSGNMLSGTYTPNVTVFGITVSGGTSTYTVGNTTVMTRTSVQSAPYQIYWSAPFEKTTARQITISGTVAPAVWGSPRPTEWSSITRSSAVSKGSRYTTNPPVVVSTNASSGALGFAARVVSLLQDSETSNFMGLTTNSTGTGPYYTQITFSNGTVYGPGGKDRLGDGKIPSNTTFTVKVAADGVVNWYSNDTLAYTSNVGAASGPLYAVVSGQNGGDNYAGLVFPAAPTPVTPYWRGDTTVWTVAESNRLIHGRNNEDTLYTSATLTTGRVSWVHATSLSNSTVGFRTSADPAYFSIQGSNVNDFPLPVVQSDTDVQQILRTPLYEMYTLNDVLQYVRPGATEPVQFFVTSGLSGDTYSNLVFCNTIPKQWATTTGSGWTLGDDLTFAYTSNVSSTLYACNSAGYGSMLLATAPPAGTWVGLARASGDPTADPMSFQMLGGSAILLPPYQNQAYAVTFPLRFFWGANTFTVYDSGGSYGPPAPIFRGPLADSTGAGYTGTLKPYIRTSVPMPVPNFAYIDPTFAPAWQVMSGIWTHTPSGTITCTGAGVYQTQWALSGCRFQFTPTVAIGFIVDFFTTMPYISNALHAEYIPKDGGWKVAGTQTNVTGGALEVFVSTTGDWQFLSNSTVVTSGTLDASGGPTAVPLTVALRGNAGDVLSNVNFLSVAPPDWTVFNDRNFTAPSSSWTLQPTGTVAFSNATGAASRIYSTAAFNFPKTLTVQVSNAAAYSGGSTPYGSLKVGFLHSRYGLSFYWSTRVQSDATPLSAVFDTASNGTYEQDEPQAVGINGTYSIAMTPNLTRTQLNATFTDETTSVFTVSDTYADLPPAGLPPPYITFFEVSGLSRFEASYSFS